MHQQSPLSLTDIRSPDKAPASAAAASSAFLLHSQLQLQPLPFALKPTPANQQANTKRGTSPQQQQAASLSQYAPSVPSPRFGQQPPSPAHQQQQQAAAANDQTFQSGSDSFSRSVSPTRSQLANQFGLINGQAGMDASFRSAGSASQSQMQQPARTAAAMSEMLSKAREGLHKLQAEVELERQRRQSAERELADAKRDLSNERLAGSSSAHSAQLLQDKENRLLRELAAQKLLEASLRAQVAEESDALTHEREERIRLTERLEHISSELRTAQETLRAREEELLSLRKQHATESSQTGIALQECRSEIKRQQDELRLKDVAIKETEVAMKQIDNQLTQLDTQKAARESQRLLDEQRSATRITELQSALDSKSAALVALQQSYEQMRTENTRLQGATRDTTQQMEDKLSTATRRIDDLQSQERAFALETAALKERLNAKTSEASKQTTEISELKQQNILLASEHTHHLNALQDQYQKHLHELETNYNASRQSGVDEQRHSFEVAINNLERDVERAITAGMQGREQSFAATLSPSRAASPAFSSPIDAASASLSPRGSGHRDSAGASFYLAPLALFKEQVLRSLDSGFQALHQSRAQVQQEAQQELAALRQEAAALRQQLSMQTSTEQDLSRRLAQLSEQHAHDLRSHRSGGEQEQLLLQERATVIRELKRRYKKEQSTVATLSSQLAQTRDELSRVLSLHSSEVEQWRHLSASELQSAIRATESLSSKRLDAENRLRRKAEEEADRYVRECQSIQQKVFTVQQEKQQLIEFFKEQLGALTREQSVRAGALSEAESDARLNEKLDRFMRQSGMSPRNAAPSPRRGAGAGGRGY